MDVKLCHGARVEVKDADRGEVVAVFATFNVKDHDGDVTVPGAFEDGAPAPISAYQHKSWDGALPVGVGSIRTTNTEALLEGRFFLDTAEGANTFTVVKNLAEHQLGEWSYGYDPVKFSFGEHEGERVRFLEQQKVHEVSPVLLGAGINTRTLAAKAAGRLPFGEHGDAVVADVRDLVDRALRAAKGHPVRSEAAAVLHAVDTELKRLAEVLEAARKNANPDDEQQGTQAAEVKAAVDAEYLRFVSLARR